MTLQAKDLMVGDLLTFYDCVKDGKIIPIEVVELHGYNNDFLASINGDEACDILEFDDEIVGIPLTPEILEKNGWSEDYSGRYFPEDTNFKLELSVEGKTVLWTINCYEYEIIRLSYVHELQHALKLCGIDKEIIL